MNVLILYENVGIFCTKKNIMLVIFVLKTLNILIFIRKEKERKTTWTRSTYLLKTYSYTPDTIKVK